MMYERAGGVSHIVYTDNTGRLVDRNSSVLLDPGNHGTLSRHGIGLGDLI